MACANIDKLQCQICGQAYESLVSHIVRGHKIEVSEYLSRFPDSCLVTLSVRKRMADAWTQDAKDRVSDRQRDT